MTICIIREKTEVKGMNRYTLRQSAILLLTATIWGVAFVAQSVGMEYVGPFTFNAVRTFLGAIVLVPCIFVFRRRQSQNGRQLLAGGLICGVLLFVASSLQQMGIQYTSVGKAGFITALYIVLVPVIGMFFRRKTGVKIWIGVALAVIGMYLLCLKQGDMRLEIGDLLLLGCAVAYSFQILSVEHFSPLVDGVKMSCIQLFVCSFLSAICMCIFETPRIESILDAKIPILYAGIMSCGVAYTLQIIGQKGLNSTVASLIMSLESVISLLAGWIILGQTLSGRELTGCIIVFAAIVLVQLPVGRKAENKK